MVLTQSMTKIRNVTEIDTTTFSSSSSSSSQVINQMIEQMIEPRHSLIIPYINTSTSEIDTTTFSSSSSSSQVIKQMIEQMIEPRRSLIIPSINTLSSEIDTITFSFSSSSQVIVNSPTTHFLLRVLTIIAITLIHITTIILTVNPHHPYHYSQLSLTSFQHVNPTITTLNHHYYTHPSLLSAGGFDWICHWQCRQLLHPILAHGHRQRSALSTPNCQCHCLLSSKVHCTTLHFLYCLFIAGNKC